MVVVVVVVGGGAVTSPRWSELFPQFPKVIRKVSQGILIAFSDGAPTLFHRPLELRSSNKTSDLLQAVKKLLDSRAIKVDTLSPGYYRRLFLVPKPNGSFRPIINLKKLNLFLEIPSFKMETLFSIVAATGMDRQDRLKGRLSSYPGPCEHQEVLLLCYRWKDCYSWKDLSVLCASIWSFNSAKRVRQDLGSVSSAASHQRGQSPCLSRPLDHPRGLTRPECST